MSKTGGGTIEQLLGAARPRLWRAYLSVRGLEGADEPTAEALAWGWEHQDRLIEMTNPVGYLYRVGLSRTRPRKPPELPPPDPSVLPEIEPGLLPALQDLSEMQRSAVWLVHGCGWSYAEVGAALDIGTSTVGTHVTRALSSLREALEVKDHA